ncbi:uncharacterized protein Nmag_2701 [Natrialba magadii ATCC 43099]|uniref:DUF7511 domain-containing protein n=1 Tax=Natrialba magadii (strain ATCC 43099 / DSM 3394 / CCM 3739 / CIP 104546 / IAM 13178 / JCM 8861 / NBRC 102185 / NCIMB 2190 / MS3) TaxID=547559 RepID=D3SZ65_NATMM|nr:hypothetical protein [Natrialba magadii]ADD06257.1 uncharacterized protein Nmag_2701 [Natrialba magadii ATCC 43099]ELY31030.1 hypothetical protein C500_06896 [Natrialba magadii ATCC 43099]
MTYDADNWSSDTEFGDAQPAETDGESETSPRTPDRADQPDQPDQPDQTAHDHEPLTERDGPTPSVELDHVTIDNGPEADECALFPADAPEEELMTNWISAIEGSFVDLDSMR